MTVTLDGVELGRIKDERALLQSASFRLPDRANLRVQLVKKPLAKILVVTRNAHPLPRILGPEAAIKSGCDYLFLMALWNGVPGLIMLLTREPDLFYLGVGGLIAGAAFAALGVWGRTLNPAPFWIGAALLAVNVIYILAKARGGGDNPIGYGTGAGAVFASVMFIPALVRAATAASNLPAQAAKTSARV